MFARYRPDRCYIIAEIGGNFTALDDARRLIDETRNAIAELQKPRAKS